MMFKYELWFIVRRAGKDVAARFDTKVELAEPTQENVLALLFDLEYVSQEYEQDWDTEILIKCEKDLDIWRIYDGGNIIELRLV
jgi:hypothetical protein